MKPKISPYVQYLLTDNIYYIVIAFILLISIFIVPSVTINTYSQNVEKIFTLEEELQEINSKKNALSFLSNTSTINIDEYYNIVSSLIPEAENYFTIIYALNNLADLTNFNITSYSLNLKESTKNKLSIEVTGIGNQSEFLNFLREYNLGGGRLITAEEITLNAEEFSGITLRLNFYNQKSSLFQSGNINYKDALSKIDNLKSKIKFNFQSEVKKETAVEEYPTKTNPF